MQWTRPLRGALTVVLVLFMAANLGACASSGRNFERPDNTSLQLGQTSISEVISQFGEPRSKATSNVNDQPVITLSYAYSVATPTSSFGGNIPSRSMSFHFWEGRLVGHRFMSSFDEDSTDFDPSLAERLHVGKSTEADVIHIFGEPDGVSIYPVVEDETVKVFSYGYLQGKGRLFSVKFSSKGLDVTFDENGIVKDIDSSNMVQN